MIRRAKVEICQKHFNIMNDTPHRISVTLNYHLALKILKHLKRVKISSYMYST